MRASFVRSRDAGYQGPSQVVGLVATSITSTQISLSWSPIAGASNYTVRRNGDPIINTGGATNATDIQLPPSTAESYTVAAINSLGEGPKSAILVVTTSPPPGQAPGQVQGLVGSPTGSTQITLSWSATATATSYNIRRNGAVIGSISGSPYNDTGLASSTTYTYTVAAVNAFGEGIPSAPTNVTTNASGVAIKWHPAHYKRLGLGDNHATAYNDILSDPNVGGGNANGLNWATCEPTQGNYVFTQTNSDIALLSAHGKYYMCEWSLIVYNQSDPTGIIPEYILTNPIYGDYGLTRGGVKVYGAAKIFPAGVSSAIVPAVWDNGPVQARMAAMWKALGQTFDSNPWFSMFGTAETIIGLGNGATPPGYTFAKVQQFWQAMTTVLHTYFPTTPTALMTNYLGSTATELYNVMVSCLGNAVGVGGPDILLPPGESTGMKLAQDALSPSTIDFRGQVPFLLQSERNLGKTAAQLYPYAVGTLGANFVCWQNDQNAASSIYWPNVKAFLDTGTHPVNTALPSCYN